MISAHEQPPIISPPGVSTRMNDENELSRQRTRSLARRLLLRFLLLLAFLALLIFLPAGTVLYWQAFVFFAVLVVPMVFTLHYFIRHHPELLERRLRAKEKEKRQRLFVAIMAPVYLAAFIVPGLDHRFGWSNVPASLVVIADALVLSGYIMIFFVFKQNAYASRIIEVTEGQKVISTGLYGCIRHPMYLGSIIMYLPIPIALGSYWGLIPMSLLVPGLVFRILNEEQVLLDRLSGYREYCAKTRYRLIPFIW